MRLRPPKHPGRFLPALCTFACLPLLYLLAYLTLPYAAPALSPAAVLSAELSFPHRASGEAEAGAASLPADELPSASSSSASEPDTPASSQAESEGASEPASSTVSSQPPNAADTALELEEVVIPDKPAGAGTVVRKTYPKSGEGSIYIANGAASIKNCTTVTAETIRKTIDQLPDFTFPKEGEPMVLIMHTHATESYQPYAVDWYDTSYTCRTTDTQQNMCRVGDAIQTQLEAAGIGVIHDTTLHDYPSYNGAYERSAVTVKQYLEQYPSIQVVLDVHRDAIQTDPTTMVAPVATIDGKACAQVMIISGCDDGGMNMPNYLENLKLSAALSRTMEQDYPGLTRPVLFDYRKYNQDLTTGSILLEIGGHANTLEEAVYAGELVGKSLAKTLLALQ